MESFHFGEIVILPFSYTDLQSGKRRPALVLVDTGDDDILVAKLRLKCTNRVAMLQSSIGKMQVCLRHR
jgi:hypothetical protein